MKTRNIKALFSIMAMAMIMISCQKDIVKDPNQIEYETDLQQFEAVWNGLNTSYVMWPIDSTDWDKVYKEYRPVFEDMENKNDEEWTDAWKALSSTLMDHHLTIHLERPSTNKRINITPGFYEVASRDSYHLRLTSATRLMRLNALVLEGRLKDVSVYNQDDIVILSGILDDETAYIYISSLKVLINSTEPFQHFRQLVANEDIHSAVIDLRDNLGGFAANVNYLLSCFKSKGFYIGYNQTKTGLGRYELGPKVPQYVGAGVTIEGVELQGQDRDIPVVALCNIFSVSASEISTLAIKCLPHGYVLGERTWGATCALFSDFGLFYSGSFGDSQEDSDGNWIGHGHYVYTPKYLFSGVDGTVYEGHGIEPDKECLFDQSAWYNGIDNQLECALTFAKEKAQ